jgi:hypothetical protein
MLLVRCVPNPNPGTTTTTLPGGTNNCSPGQKELTLAVPVADGAHPELGNGSDLDNGWTGTSHNFPVIGGSSLVYCLSGCDVTTTFDCTATGTTGAGTANGATFGAPLPLLAANVPVCVVNQFVDTTLNGTYNLQTGAAGSAANPNLVHTSGWSSRTGWSPYHRRRMGCRRSLYRPLLRARFPRRELRS